MWNCCVSTYRTWNPLVRSLVTSRTKHGSKISGPLPGRQCLPLSPDPQHLLLPHLALLQVFPRSRATPSTVLSQSLFHSSGSSWRRNHWKIHSYGCICNTTLRWRDGDIFSDVLLFPGQCGDLTVLSVLCTAKTKAGFGAIWTGPESYHCLLPTLWPWAKARFLTWVSFIYSFNTDLLSTYYIPCSDL